MDMNCYCSSVEMSGPPFQIASMDENGILNTWVSNMYIEKVEYSIRIIIKKKQCKFCISDENFISAKYSIAGLSDGVLLNMFDLTP